MPSVTLRTRHNLADLPEDLDPVVRTSLESRLTYNHKLHLRGADAFDPETHAYTPVQVVPTRLYSYANGRLCFPAGFAETVVETLKEHDLGVDYVDLNGPRPRPNAYDFRPENIFKKLGPFRPRQAEAVAAIASHSRGVVLAPTAFGKGHVKTAVIAAYPNARIDVVVSRTKLAKSLRRRFLAVEPGVGLVGAGSKEYGRRVTVYVDDSLKYAPHDENEADIVLVDEVHETPTESTLEQLRKYKTARMYGFTASFGMRADGADHRLEGFFGRPIFQMSYQEAEALGLVVPIEVRCLRTQKCDWDLQGLSDIERERQGIWKNLHRNQLFAEEARKHLEGGDQVMLWVRTVEHVMNLHALLPEFELCYDKLDPADEKRYVAQGLMTGREPKMTRKRLDQTQIEFEQGKLRAVIANDVWSTGVDFPQLGVLLRADARSSKIMDTQGPGRVCRKSDATGKQVGLVIDGTDEFDPGYHAKFNKRRRSYSSFGWAVGVLEGGRVTPYS